MAELAVGHGGRSLAAKFHQEICDLYDATFSVPPFEWSDAESAEHSHLLTAIRDDPSFGIVLATSGEALVGFAYGHGLPVDHGWWTGFPAALPADLVREWPGRTFAVIDFAVDRRWWGQGVGRRLLAHLLAGRAEERAVLSVQPTAVRAQRLYQHLGWRRVGRKGPLTGVTPPYWDIFLHPLR